MELLHGSVLELVEPQRTLSVRSLAVDARQVTDKELSTLLDSEWRSRLTAAWLIGLDRRTQFCQRLGELLLESNFVFAGQGYCFALARFGDISDAGLLVAYLDRYLPRLDCYYDQHWALGALLHLDEYMGTNHAGRFLIPNGLWQQSAMRHVDLAEQKSYVDRLCAFADDCMAGGTGHAP